MNVFWRKEPLNETEVELYELVREAHYHSCFRQNSSSVTVVNAYGGSGSFSKAIAAGLLTLGGKHAPLREVIGILASEYGESVAAHHIKEKTQIQGWGNSFIRGERDPVWLRVDDCLKEKFPEMYEKITKITKVLHDNGKDVYPNPACYTAALVLLLEVPPQIAEYIFIEARLVGWTQLILQQK